MSNIKIVFTKQRNRPNLGNIFIMTLTDDFYSTHSYLSVEVPFYIRVGGSFDRAGQFQTIPLPQDFWGQVLCEFWGNFLWLLSLCLIVKKFNKFPEMSTYHILSG